MIFDALAGVPGVTFDNGVWNYLGQPIVVNIIQRIEDLRFQIGQYVAQQIASMGFTPNLIPKSGGGAFAIVYNGPPDTGAWQLYTEGWANTALVAWQDTDPDFYLCGGEGSAIWYTSGGPYRPDPELADVCHKLLYAEYTSQAERKTLIEKSIDLGLKQGIRVWTVAGATFAYSKRLAPFSYDLSGGPWSFFTTRSMAFKDPNGNPAVGGQLKLGQRLMFLSQWQPWQGFGWLYDDLVRSAFTDYGTWLDPHTGKYIPVRSDFAVQTNGPTGTLDVPSTSYTFNTTTNAWEQVGTGVKALSKVTFTLTFGKWHDGTDMTMSDYLYAISLGFRRDHGDIDAVDHDSALPGTRLFVNTFRGLNVVDATHLEIYINYWHIDPSYIAGTADFFPSIPWEASELAMQTVLHNNTRVSEVTASTDGKEALDVTKGASIGFMDREISDGNVTSAWVPPGFASGPFAISSTDAAARWASLQTWRSNKLHYYPSNGPYLLDTLTPALIAAHQVLLTNNPSYPFPADRWASLVTPKIPSVSIGAVSSDCGPYIVPGFPTTINITTSVSGSPYANIDMNWLVVNPASGAALLAGTPTASGTGNWQVVLNETLTGQLVPGAYNLRTVTVGREAVVPVISTKSFVVIPSVVCFQAILARQISEVNADVTKLQNDLNTANNNLASAQSTINSLTTLLYASIGIALIGVVIAIVSVGMLMRRRGGGGGKGGGKTPEEMSPTDDI
jgi:peptide/nickel transport system substrate-binding protein